MYVESKHYIVSFILVPEGLSQVQGLVSPTRPYLRNCNLKVPVVVKCQDKQVHKLSSAWEISQV